MVIITLQDAESELTVQENMYNKSCTKKFFSHRTYYLLSCTKEKKMLIALLIRVVDKKIKKKEACKLMHFPSFTTFKRSIIKIKVKHTHTKKNGNFSVIESKHKQPRKGNRDTNNSCTAKRDNNNIRND